MIFLERQLNQMWLFQWLHGHCIGSCEQYELSSIVSLTASRSNKKLSEMECDNHKCAIAILKLISGF